MTSPPIPEPQQVPEVPFTEPEPWRTPAPMPGVPLPPQVPPAEIPLDPEAPPSDPKLPS